MRDYRSICLVLLLFLASLWKINATDRGAYAPVLRKSVRPDMKVMAVEEREGYECRLVEFSVEADERIKAYLLVPEHASRLNRCPAVVMLHDHGARFDIGKEKLVRPIRHEATIAADDHIIRSSRQWVDVNFDGVYLADSLAALGYVVLVADALYWGDRSSADAQHWSEMNFSPESTTHKAEIRRLKNIVYEGQRMIYDSLYADGVIWAEKMLRDDAASVRLLRRLPYVDKRNIGSFGFSMGAHRCWMLCAFCDEVKCGVALSWMTTLDRTEEMSASDYSMAVMPMREVYDFGDIGIWLRPKPMLFLSGDSDRLFPKENVQIGFETLQRHYSEYNAQHKIYGQPPFEPLQTVFFNGGHHCGKDVQSLIVDYFRSYLE